MPSPATLAARSFLNANPIHRQSAATPNGSATVPTNSASVPTDSASVPAKPAATSTTTSSSTTSSNSTKKSSSLTRSRLRMLSSFLGPTDMKPTKEEMAQDLKRMRQRRERQELERTLEQMFPSPPRPPQSSSEIEKDIESLERQLQKKRQSLAGARHREGIKPTPSRSRLKRRRVSDIRKKVQ
jgi:hypothetical protein